MRQVGCFHPPHVEDVDFVSKIGEISFGFVLFFSKDGAGGADPKQQRFCVAFPPVFRQEDRLGGTGGWGHA